MAPTAVESAREVAALRAETERLLDTLEGRARSMLGVPRQLAANPLVVAAVGAIGLVVVLLLWYRSYRRAQEARRPMTRLRRGATALGETARSRAHRVRQALSGEPLEERPEADAQHASLLQKVVGTIAASATLALVDQLTRWLSKRGTSVTREAPNG